jgi:hypothetical protein
MRAGTTGGDKRTTLVLNHSLVVQLWHTEGARNEEYNTNYL